MASQTSIASSMSSQSTVNASGPAAAGFSGSVGADFGTAFTKTCLTTWPSLSRVIVYLPCIVRGSWTLPSSSGVTLNTLPSGVVTVAVQFWSGVHAVLFSVSWQVLFSPTTPVEGHDMSVETHWCATQLCPVGQPGQPASVPQV